MRSCTVKAQTSAQSYPDDSARWNALLNRDPRADGCFFYGVLTTGVYCRPDCRSRLPRRENVRFFSSTDEARHAGLRPCKRCQPDGAKPSEELAKKMHAACRFLESAEARVPLAQLARQAALSPWYFQRVFTRIVGVTPNAYGQAIRAERVRQGLRSQRPITEIVYSAGYSSSSRFYSRAGQMLGMTPTNYKSGGNGESLRTTVARTSLGLALVAASERGICAILLGDSEGELTTELHRRFPKARLAEADAAFKRLVSQVIKAVEEPQADSRLPLDLRGTAFQQRVWQKLCEIPLGQTCSYAEIARQLGEPTAARAVARACASNHVAVLVPCHRVVRSDGGLSGYRWGVRRKSELLRREKAAPKT